MMLLLCHNQSLQGTDDDLCFPHEQYFAASLKTTFHSQFHVSQLPRLVSGTKQSITLNFMRDTFTMEHLS